MLMVDFQKSIWQFSYCLEKPFETLGYSKLCKIPLK